MRKNVHRLYCHYPLYNLQNTTTPDKKGNGSNVFGLQLDFKRLHIGSDKNPMSGFSTGSDDEFGDLGKRSVLVLFHSFELS